MLLAVTLLLPNGRQLLAHTQVLAKNSQKFAALFASGAALLGG